MDETEETLTTVIKLSEQSMLFWALQYGLNVEVIEPQSLRESIRDAVALISEKYKI